MQTYRVRCRLSFSKKEHAYATMRSMHTPRDARAPKAKKSLGQHFLRSNSAIKAIVSAGKIEPTDTVLEIGPGQGVLTRALLATGARVIAIEKDRDLIPVLLETFPVEIQEEKLVLIEQDILDFTAVHHNLAAGSYKLIANIPYYITGAIIEQFLTEENPPERMVLLIQKEVATRILARDGKESILSLSVKAFGIPKLVAKVPASAFRPAPKVDSAILEVSHISFRNFLDWNIPKEEAVKRFFDVVHAGFAHKRKLLARNLEVVATRDRIVHALESLNVSLSARAEDLSLETWVRLAKLLSV